MCFSPVGNNFKIRIRTFPSLVNCTTIDWFLPWSNEALGATANRLISSYETIRSVVHLIDSNLVKEG